MAFCTECGTQLPAGARFCPGCGATAAPVANEAAAQATEAPFQARLAGVPPASSSAAGPTSYAQPIQSGGGSGAAWILPILIVIAALAIGYTLFNKAPERAATGPTAKEASAGDGAATADDMGSTGDTRAVDQASLAADRASAGIGSSARSVSATTLDSAFFRDPAGASALYSGPIRVTGVIASMVQPGSTPALSMEGRSRSNYMIVNFPAGYRERLAPLSKGQVIQVECERARALGGTTILDECALD